MSEARNVVEQKQPLVEPPTASNHGKPADFMLVFFLDQDGKPAEGAADTLYGRDVISSIFVHKEETIKIFPKLYEACGKDQKGKTLTKKEARDAVLQDFCNWLPAMGFTVKTFKSIDEDELMMYITLDDDKAQRFYADKNNMHLQLSEQTVEKMGITYPENEPKELTTPPYVTFDKEFEEDVVKTRFSGMKTIFRDKFMLKNKDGSILRQVDCIRIIRRAIMRLVDLDDMVACGILAAKYPIHVLKPLDELRAEWASFNLVKILNPWSAQPLLRLRNYYGESVAFYFAWMGLTVRRLTILAFLGVGYKAACFVCLSEKPRERLIADLLWGGVMAIWSTAYITSWKRMEHQLSVEWDMLEFSSRAALRPDFRGEMLPNPLNTSEETKQFSAKRKALYSVFSSAVTYFFFGISYVSIASMRPLEPFFDSLVPGITDGRGKTMVSIGIAVLIQILNFFWSLMAKKLVQLENPKTDAEYSHLLVWKLGPFSLFTAYNTFIWISLFQGFFARHPAILGEFTPCEPDCVTLLQVSVVTTFATLAALMLVGMAIPFLMLKYRTESEIKAYRKEQMEKQGKQSPDEVEVPLKSFMEQQAKMDVYNTDAEIGDYLTNVTCIGYVMLFGGASPAAAFIALIVMLFQIRAHAYKLTRLLRRPYPTMCKGIGSWNDMLEGLAWVSLVFYIGIPILNSRFFINEETAAERLLNNSTHADAGTAPAHQSMEETMHSMSSQQLEQLQIMLFFLAEHIIIAIKLGVGTLIPSETASAKLLHDRRQYVKDRLLLGKDDPQGLPDECKKDPIDVASAIKTSLTQTSSDWGFVDHRVMNLALCGPKGKVTPENELPDDRDNDV